MLQNANAISAGGYDINNSLRFRSSASAYLNRTPGSAGNQQIFTWSGWVKRGQLSSEQAIIVCRTGSNAAFGRLVFTSGDALQFFARNSSSTTTALLNTTQVFRDPSAWYHIVLAVDTTQATAANRIKFYVNGTQITAFSTATYPSQNTNLDFNTTADTYIGVEIPNAIYFDGYMAEVNFVNAQQLTPSSFGETDTTTGVWKPKAYTGTYGTNGFYLPFTGSGTNSYAGSFNGSNQWLNGTLASAIGSGDFTVEGWVYQNTLTNYQTWFSIDRGATGFNIGTDASGSFTFYSSSAAQISVSGVIKAGTWQHIAFVRNGSTLTAYYNGVSKGTATVSTNFSATNFYIGALDNTPNEPCNSSFSNFRVTGTAVYTSNFTPSTQALTAITGTKLLTLQSSTIVDNSGNSIAITNNNSVTTTVSNPFLGTNIASDQSGNGNNWTPTNISVTSGTTYDAMKDSPTNTSATVANYCVLNPLQKYSGLSAPTNGNLTIAGNSANWRSILSTFAVSSGKWYCEINMTSVSTDALVGIFNINNASDLNDLTTVDNRQLARYSGGYGYQNNGNKVNNNTGTSYGATWTTGDVIAIALDMDAGTITFYKNNTSQGTAYSSLSGLFAIGISTANGTFDANFGQRPFSYTPPTGYVALNTYNLPDSTIKKGNTVMDATLWTGTGGARTITNAAGFRPDWVWVKRRSSADDHYSYDSVRGANLNLVENSTVAEANVTTYGSGGIGAATSTGFTIVAGTTNADNLNGSGITYVGWQWQAGQGSTSSNTLGSITSTVSVNATAGFSIVTYTGTGANATVGHGLGVAPKMMIVKCRGTAGLSWVVYNSVLGNTKYLLLQTTDAEAAASTVWNNTTPTSSVFSIGTDNGINGSTRTYVAYCWAEIAGYSKAFSYTGNGSTDGVFVYLGFRPKFVLLKGSSGVNDWYIHDSTRNTYNLVDLRLEPNSSLAEVQSAVTVLDFLSNGFKLRTSNGGWNGSGSTYIGMAFAENPFKNSLAR